MDSLNLELTIISARNTYLNNNNSSAANQLLFVRCYLCAGKSSNTRVKLDTQQISSKSHDLIWNHTFSLNCSGDRQAIECLEKGTVVFELRRRSTSAGPFRRGSKLVARAEIPWNDVVAEKKAGVMEKWVVMIPEKNGRRVYDDVMKPPAVRVGLRVEEFAERKIVTCCRERRWDDGEDCGCKCCVDSQFFAIGAALDAL